MSKQLKPQRGWGALGHQSPRIICSRKAAPETPKSRNTIDYDPQFHARFLGTYKDKGGAMIHVKREDDHLAVVKPGQYDASMYPQSETTCFVPLANSGTARFEIEEDGNIRLSIVDDSGKVHVRAIKTKD